MSQVLLKYKTITGVFSERYMEPMLRELQMRNVPLSEISVLMSEHTGNSVIKIHGSNKTAEGAAIGGVSGGIIGAIVGGLTLVGSVLAPGVGLLAVGWIVGALAGTAAGIGAGGLLGALIGMGIPEHEARYYEDALQEEGNMMIVVRTPEDMVPEIKALYQRYEAKYVNIAS